MHTGQRNPNLVQQMWRRNAYGTLTHNNVGVLFGWWWHCQQERKETQWGQIISEEYIFLLAGMIMLGAENSKHNFFPEEEQLLFTPYPTFKLAKRIILHHKWVHPIVRRVVCTKNVQRRMPFIPKLTFLDKFFVHIIFSGCLFISRFYKIKYAAY